MGRSHTQCHLELLQIRGWLCDQVGSQGTERTSALARVGSDTRRLEGLGKQVHRQMWSQGCERIGA